MGLWTRRPDRCECSRDGAFEIGQRARGINDRLSLARCRIQLFKRSRGWRPSVVEYYERAIIEPRCRGNTRHRPAFRPKDPLKRELSFAGLAQRGHYAARQD